MTSSVLPSSAYKMCIRDRYLYIPTGTNLAIKELYKMLPYVVTLAVLIIVSLRKKREDQPPASLGLSFFREER